MQAVSSQSSDSEATQVPSTVEPKAKGKWGERASGEGVDVTRALDEYRQISRQLSGRPPASSSDEDDGEGRFDLAAYVRRHNEAHRKAGLAFDKRLGVVFKCVLVPCIALLRSLTTRSRELGVQGVSSDASFNKDLGRAILGTFGPDLFHFLATRYPNVARHIPGYHVPLRPLLQGFTGSLKDEMVHRLHRWLPYAHHMAAPRSRPTRVRLLHLLARHRQRGVSSIYAAT
jgi:hypothetical protein